jgi:hypothetical protein
MLHDHQN